MGSAHSKRRSSAGSDPPHRALCEQRSRRAEYFGWPSVVLAISHMGSWELYAQAAFQRPETRFGTIYQALRNPHLDELINRDRQKGVDTFDRKRVPSCHCPVAKTWMHGSAGGSKCRQWGNLDAVFQPPVFDVPAGGRSGDSDQFGCRASGNLHLRLRPLARCLWGRDLV